MHRVELFGLRYEAESIVGLLRVERFLLYVELLYSLCVFVEYDVISLEFVCDYKL